MKLLSLFIMLILGTVTAFGQFTPQRINYNNTPGVFFSLKQEEMLLKSMVELDAFEKENALLKQNLQICDVRLDDKDVAINRLTTELGESRASDKANLLKIGSLQNTVDKLSEDLANERHKLAKANGRTVIFGGTSLLFLGTTVLLLLK